MVSPVAYQYLVDEKYVKWISEVSLFELAIKLKIGKLQQFDIPLVKYIRQIQEDGFQLLPIKKEHIVAYDQIPLIDDHRDLFDRLILASAFHGQWPVMSADHKFSWYKNQIDVIW